MKRHCKLIGCILIVSGLLVVLSMVLPTTFWWFLLGVILICAGIALLRRQ